MTTIKTLIKERNCLKILCFVPFYNEEDNLPDLINRIKINNYKIDEFLFVNSGSTDNSSEIVSKTGHTLINLNVNKGLGYLFIQAINYGIEKKYDVIVVLSGNNKMNPKDFKTVLDPILYEDFDFVWGSRFIESGKSIDTPKFRATSIPILSKFVSLINNRKVSDATNGFRAFKLEVINELIRNYDKPWLYGYSFETYLFGLVLGSKNINSTEVPVEIKYNKNQKHTKIKPVFDYPSIVLPFIYARLKTIFKNIFE